MSAVIDSVSDAPQHRIRGVVPMSTSAGDDQVGIAGICMPQDFSSRTAKLQKCLDLLHTLFTGDMFAKVERMLTHMCGRFAQRIDMLRSVMGESFHAFLNFACLDVV